MRKLTLVFLAVITACSGKPKLRGEACQRAWLEAGAWFDKVRQLPSRGSIRFETELVPDGSVTEVIDEQFVVEIDGDGIHGSGGVITGDQLDREFESHIRRYQKLGQPRPDFLLIAAAPDAKWSDLVEVVQSARRSGMPAEIYFAFAVPGFIPAPQHQAIWKEIEKAYDDPSTSVDTYGVSARPIPTVTPVLRKLMAPCPDVVAKLTSDPFHPEVVFAPTVGECRCSVDLEAVKAVVWHMAEPDRAAARKLQLVDEAAAAKIISAPAGAKWSEVAAKVAALNDGQPVVLRVE